MADITDNSEDENEYANVIIEPVSDWDLVATERWRLREMNEQRNAYRKLALELAKELRKSVERRNTNIPSR